MKLRKYASLCLVAAALALCPACVIRSLHPWFTNEFVTFEGDLVGGWVGAAEGEVLAMSFVRGEGDSYVVQYFSREGGKGFVKGQGLFEAKLARLAGDYYMSFRPAEETLKETADGLFLFRAHSLARLELGQNTLTIRMLNYDAWKTAAQKGQLKDLRYDWTDDGELLLVATSDELRRFLLAHSRDSDLFGEPLRLVRKK